MHRPGWHRLGQLPGVVLAVRHLSRAPAAERLPCVLQDQICEHRDWIGNLMSAAWLKTEARGGDGLTKHPRAGRCRLRNSAPTFGSRGRLHAFGDPQTGFDEAPINNESLTFRGNEAPDGPPAPRRSAAGHGRLNAFFALSVNSPPVSMVNFSCCVCSAPKPCARRVTRRVAPQPTRSAVRMEAGVHAGV